MIRPLWFILCCPFGVVQRANQSSDDVVCVVPSFG